MSGLTVQNVTRGRVAENTETVIHLVIDNYINISKPQIVVNKTKSEALTAQVRVMMDCLNRWVLRRRLMSVVREGLMLSGSPFQTVGANWLVHSRL